MNGSSDMALIKLGEPSGHGDRHPAAGLEEAPGPGDAAS
jgi:hypothetical protein